MMTLNRKSGRVAGVFSLLPLLSSLLLLVALPSLSSCDDDKGNYDYHDINEITISGIEKEYTVLNGIDKLEIHPKITTTMGDENLEYQWKLQRAASPDINPTYFIGTERDLSYEVNLPNIYDYSLILFVTDKKTGVVTSASCTVHVTTRTGNGIMLLGENEQGNAELEFISIASDTLVLPNMLNEGTGFPAPLGKPVTICSVGKSSLSYRNWVVTEDEGFRISESFNMVEGSELSQMLFLTDDSYGTTPQKIVEFYPHKTRSLRFTLILNSVAISEDGLMFIGTVGFVDPVNIVQGEKEVSRCKPYIMNSTRPTALTTFIYYDETHERFLQGNLSQSYATALTDTDGDPFPWNNAAVNRTMQFGQGTMNKDGGSTYGNSFALMRDKLTNEYYIYKFYINASTRKKLDCYSVGKVATDLDKAEFHAFSSKRTALYYTVGSKLYGLDYNKGNEKVFLIRDFGEPITMMRMDDQIEPDDDFIYLATYSQAKGGTFMKLEQGTDPDKLELNEVPGSKWTGLNKIKAYTWK